MQNWSWGAFIGVAYVIGGTANHSLFLAIHEMSHNLGAKSLLGNQLIGMMANIPIVIPYSVTFRPYHMAHHRNQGLWGEDTDIPTAIEAYVVTKSATCYLDHTLRKALFMFCQIFAYALRPMLMKPETVPNDLWIVMNWIVVGAADVAIFLAGSKSFTPLFYLLLSTFFAGSIHPTAGHFIAEHYVFQDKVETYSYYGWLNMLAYNVGYHNEHHDFPNIPWSRLPRVREIAPEFYRNLPQCKSWPGTILSFIFDDHISPFSRVTRQPETLNKKKH